MRYKAPGICPVCNHELVISKLSCSHCCSQLEGEFTSCKFCRLPEEQMEFIEVFLKCRGSIKDVEKELGISYPTVRNRLDTVIQSLGYHVDKSYNTEEIETHRQEILTALEEGKITAKEAADEFKKLGKNNNERS